MKTYARELTLFFTLLLACPIGHAAEQDNWYLANEWSVSNTKGVAYYEDDVTGTRQIYVCNGSGTSAKISVYDLNGSLARHITIATSRNYANDLALDENGTIYIAEYHAVTCLENDGTFKWRKGKNASISSYGSGGTGNAEFDNVQGIMLHHSTGEIFVAERNNRRIQVLDKNGNFLRKFGSQGTAPGQFYELKNLAVDSEGKIHAADRRRISVFNPDGTFLRRHPEQSNSSDWEYVSISKGGLLISHQGHVYNLEMSYIGDLPFDDDARTLFTPEGDIIESYNHKIRIWKRAYRTKGLPVRNVIPQPAVRAITQRAGTNIIDLDFEIIDPDDANATVGILAAQDGAFTDTSKWILPQTWVDGTASKIGTPIATNQVHRVSWNVKPDWTDSTGTLKFEIICHDARRTSPVDLHFLTLPLPDGNLTISRSPLKDSDFESYAKFLIATRATGVFVDINGSIIENGAQVPNGSTQYIFTNCGASGKDGPTWTEVNASYLGTNLAGTVSMTTQGIQEWTVPHSGTYVVEAAGAMGGRNPDANADFGYGAYARGKFNLSVGDKIKILVGQMGLNSTSNNSGGGGGSFVTTDSDIPL
ncbi:glycine-rich protein, partial [Verrucomicrobia bacterium]|nr:glycine-rich protein [Verrucomicrobiota bacterium]